MALQGNLRDFSATEILQLLGSQKKTGRLTLSSGPRRFVIFVLDGQIVAARPPGLQGDDPLLDFLRRVHRVTHDQAMGLAVIHQQNGRDLEDLLVEGRYLDAEDLGMCIERQILDSLGGAMGWNEGTYEFDPDHKWERPPAVRLSMDGVLIEIARRLDEEQRYAGIFKDPDMLLQVRDLPDPDQPVTDEESELFGLIDGRHTLTEIEDEAALTRFEARDALNRMLEANWIEISGRRAGPPAPVAAAPVPGPQRPAARPPASRGSMLRELALAVVVTAALVALRFEARYLAPPPPGPVAQDVFAAATLRDLRSALELFRREQGSYPDGIEELVKDSWIGSGQARLQGYLIQYRTLRRGQDYRLELVAAQ
jgi:uncharacterized protein DUF4388